MLEGHRQFMPSQTAQKIADQLWSSFESYLYSNGKKIHRKSYGQLHTLQGKSIKTGIRYIDGKVYIGRVRPAGLKGHDYHYGICAIPRFAKPPKNGMMPSPSYDYETRMMQHKLLYCMIKQEPCKSGFRYFVIFVLEGKPEIKYNTKTGTVLHPIGNGNVGVDIGTSTVAVAGNKQVLISRLAEKIEEYEKQICITNKLMSDAFRKANQAFFNKKGNIIRLDVLRKNNPQLLNNFGKRNWKRTDEYYKLLEKRRYLYAKQKLLRKLYHNALANQILSFGNSFYIEKMDFSALAKRAKKTQKNAKGKFKRKKRFGKSMLRYAPASFVQVLKKKVLANGGIFEEVDTKTIKASQYNHMSNTTVKKSLSQRWNHMPNGNVIQRDLYSAFLLSCIVYGYIDRNLCNMKYSNFVPLHNAEIARLKNIPNFPKCIGL